MMIIICCSLILLSLVSDGLGRVYESFADLPDIRFDFVIVGGGTAGNVLANRLTENRKHSVLVLEAGPTNDGVLNSEVPYFCPKLTPGSAWDWNFTTTPQPGLNGRSLDFPRGYMLGGSSSVNFMFYTRGSKDDYDRYARISGDEGWSWENMLPYILKNERFVPPADHHDTTGQFDPAVHDYSGVNFVSLPGYPRGTDEIVLQAAEELKETFPFISDYNAGSAGGIGWIQSTVGNGTRSSSATSYLGPAFRNRPNLHVLLHAHVTRILQSDSDSLAAYPPTFTTVEYYQGSGVAVHTVVPKREIILSAGAVGTPHILLNSGIGDSHALRAAGVETTLHLPSVGQNLTDHPRGGIIIPTTSNDTMESVYWRNATYQDEALEEWKRTRTGFLSDPPANQLGFLRFPEDEITWDDKCAGQSTPHYELIFVNGLQLPPIPETGNFFVAATVVLCPASRGNISISNNDFFAPPIVNPNYFSDPGDLAVMRGAFSKAQEFTSAPVFRDYLIGPPAVITDDDIRASIESIYHPVGTASMSPVGADWGVVDPDLRLKGAKGVRIVDASVLPLVPSAHTQAPVYALAERAADIIKEAWP